MCRNKLVELLGIEGMEATVEFCDWLNAHHEPDYVATRGEPRYTADHAAAILEGWKAGKAGA